MVTCQKHLRGYSSYGQQPTNSNIFNIQPNSLRLPNAKVSTLKENFLLHSQIKYAMSTGWLAAKVNRMTPD
ncbi:hypothetical protein EUGRSUZ_L03491 [Eucalyptus grandis]|uniref:Uncharacterized protein n=1 Tax=Eucalyptus grandis TaxID=71139 RepID=A0AAD9T8F2_EUCGR|nr:hypothetical protein EUGRSUZ_L03491 [Eucalyptus grandis]